MAIGEPPHDPGSCGQPRELQWVNWRDAFFFGGVILAVSTMPFLRKIADPVSIAIIGSGIPVVSLFIGYLMGSEVLARAKSSSSPSL